MSPETGVSSLSDRVPMMMPATTVHPAGMIQEALAKDAVISWFRGEFAAANAIIDALCGHLAQFEGRKREYESVFAAIHQRRLNWIPILQMQQYFSIADVTLELEKVAEGKRRSRGVQKAEEVDVSSPVEETKREVADRNGNGGCEVVVDDLTRDNSPKCEITNAGFEEVHSSVGNKEVCPNQEEWEARRAQIKMTKGFMAKEFVKGHMVNVVRGLKLYQDVFNDTELSKLNDYVNQLRVAGQNGLLSGETFIMYKQQSKSIKRELIQFGAPIFGSIKDEAQNNSPDSHIEPIPAPLEGVIDHMIEYHLISENRRPNGCIINFFDEGEFSQPFLKPPHLEQPITTLLLSESTMALGHTLVCDSDGNYKGPLMLSLNEGSLVVMRGNSADMARHVMCQSPTKRTSVTFFRVQTYANENTSSTTAPLTQAITVWQQPDGPPMRYGSMDAVPRWDVLRAPHLLTLPPARPMVMSPRRLPRGGTGVFLPWSAGLRKPARHLPPRAQRGRLLMSQAHKEDPASDFGISVA